MERRAKLDSKVILMMAFLAIATAIVFYDFVSAWVAPMCRSPNGLGTWCLPIGFEGPFADVWANRSLHNARLLASVKFGVVGPLFVSSVYFLILRRSDRASAIGWLVTIATLLTLLFPVIFLNDFS